MHSSSTLCDKKVSEEDHQEHTLHHNINCQYKHVPLIYFLSFCVQLDCDHDDHLNYVMGKYIMNQRANK